jgi:hypothetical protein
MKTGQLTAAIALALALPFAGPVLAADQAPPSAAPVTTQTAGGYLGVMLGPVPEALRTQLGSILPAGQGVMVRDVADDSPAAKAGLQAYDILLSYGDQKLFSAEQLSQLVYADGANRAVTLTLVRNGATVEAPVTLGTAPAAATGYPPRGMPWMPMQRHYRHPMAPLYGQPSQETTDNWETFDSLSLQKRQDGSYQAEIQYLDANGKLAKQQFTGSRDEIRDQVARQSDLPPVERQQLLDALGARDDLDPFARPFPPFGHPMMMPPWFNRAPDF